MVNMQVERTRPPVITEVRRPQVSARRRAEMEIRSMRIAETPEARKDEVPEGIPAWATRVGAYYFCQSLKFLLNIHMLVKDTSLT